MKTLLLVAHGSRREVSNNEVRGLTARLRHDAHTPFDEVHCAFLELAEPSIPSGIRHCIERGATCITVLPYFLSAGRHVATDIPSEVRQAAHEHPGVEVTIAPYLGSAGGIGELILHQATQTTPNEERTHAHSNH